MVLVEIRPNRRIWVEDDAVSNAKAVAILVHGSCARLEQYAAQVPMLQRAGLATVAFDYLGCGRSTKPNDYAAYSAQNIYQDMRAVYARYSQGYKQVVLIGHSYGCYLVSRLASEEGPGGRIAALVLIGAGFPQPGAPSLRWIFYLPTWVLAWMQPYLTDQFIKLAFHPDTFRTQPGLVERERAWSNQNPPYMFRAFHLQALTLFRSAAEYATWLRGIQVPVLVMAGDKDLLTPMEGMGEVVASHLPHAITRVVSKAGHQVHEEQAGPVKKELFVFLQQHAIAS